MKELVEVIAKSLVDYPDEVNELRPKTRKQLFWNYVLHSLTWAK